MTSLCGDVPLARRPARERDAELLFAVRKAALGPHLIATHGAWDEAAQRETFFARLARTLAEHEILEQGGEAIGCLHAVRRPGELRLNRIFLSPAFQKAGLGTLILRSLMAEADAAREPIRLRVLRANPARRLYARLGFAVTGETPTHVEMERAPGAREVSAR